MSVIHKDVHVVSSGYESRMRPWICGVGDPGTGKSHAADPHVSMVEEVCAEEETYAAGVKDDYFHLVHTRTYAAFEDKLAQTGGYGLVMTGEGHTLLSTTYPSRGFFDDSKGLRFDKMMDTSYGGKFGGETKSDRANAKRARKKGDVIPVPFLKRTNVCLALIIQDTVWIDWFVVSEAHHHEGLASRFLIPFAKGRMVGPLRFKDFFEIVYRPLVKRCLKTLLSLYSPRKDVLDPTNPVGRFFLADAEERFVKNARMTCKRAEPMNPNHRRKFITALQKSGYWIPGIAWETRMLNGAQCF